MTRKDYEAIAATLNNSRQDTRRMIGHAQGKLARTVLLCTLESELADVFAKNNPRFDRDKFIEACQS